MDISRIVQKIESNFDLTDRLNYSEPDFKLARRNYVRYVLGWKPDYRKQALYSASYGVLSR
jgi:hypothetical protein